MEEAVTKTQKKLLATEKIVSKLNGDKEKIKLKVSKQQETIVGLNLRLSDKKMEMSVRRMELKKESEELMLKRQV